MNDDLLMPDGHIWLPEEGIAVPEVEMILSRDGELLDVIRVKNSKTTVFNNMVCDQLLAAPALVKTTHMAVGTGAPVATLLGAEVARVALTSKTRSTNVVTHSADFAPGVATAALTEAGTFNVVTANTIDMHFYTSFSVLNKDAAMDLVINWTYTLT